MIEDSNAQAHQIVDSLTFAEGAIALAALRTIAATPDSAGSFAQLLGVDYLEMADGHCIAQLRVGHHLLNPHGIAHGGVTYSLADSTCGGAALSAVGEPRIVTQDMHMRYHGPVRPGLLRAEANVLHHGSRTVIVRCQVTQEGVLMASASASFAILSDADLMQIQQHRAQDGSNEPSD
ncbi:MAG: PaaI family thioesterase [Candidatus Promineifilaceae bacterium]|nr:PaaI family thioesterase [Candidatus Promineifilaceae bacterium]